jgi:hypothetical protein
MVCGYILRPIVEDGRDTILWLYVSDVRFVMAASPAFVSKGRAWRVNSGHRVGEHALPC